MTKPDNDNNAKLTGAQEAFGSAFFAVVCLALAYLVAPLIWLVQIILTGSLLAGSAAGFGFAIYFAWKAIRERWS